MLMERPGVVWYAWMSIALIPLANHANTNTLLRHTACTCGNHLIEDFPAMCVCLSSHLIMHRHKKLDAASG